MIIPNLLVTDIERSVRFYRDVLGMSLRMTISPERDVRMEGDGSGDAFAILEWDGGELMLQTARSLSEDLSFYTTNSQPSASGTIYFRGLHPNTVQDRVPSDRVLKGPEVSWYGMIELYVQDPDGYIICLGAPEGDGPKLT